MRNLSERVHSFLMFTVVKKNFHEVSMVKVMLEILKRHKGLAAILEIERLAGMAPEVHLILM